LARSLKDSLLLARPLYCFEGVKPPSTRAGVSAAAVIVLGINDDPDNSCPDFTDLSPTHIYYDDVMILCSNGFVVGYGDGTFRPDNTVTRAEISAIAVRAGGLAIDTSGGPHFTDVNPDDWFYEFVETLFNNGIVVGVGGGLFDPNALVTRVDMVTIFQRLSLL